MSNSSPPIDPLAQFEHERRRLFGIAYRMLGLVADAEDLVQEAYLRWHGVDHRTVENPSAYLVSLVTRLCIDVRRSAEHRRTSYIGQWLPEPLVAAAGADPQQAHDLTDDLATAWLMLLERLTPVERAVWVLHESFGFSYDEIGPIVGKSVVNCRQIERRARVRLAAEGRPAPVDPAQHDALLAGFLRAAQHGDLLGMVALLARDAVMYADGGGKVPSARNPVAGAENVARFVAGLSRKAVSLQVSLAQINGRTGLLNRLAGQVHSTLTFHIADGQIQGIFVQSNPDKLRHLTTPDDD